MNKWFVPLVLLVAPALLMAGGAPPNSDSLPTEVAKGRQIYEQYCAACHGWQGEGARVEGATPRERLRHMMESHCKSQEKNRTRLFQNK